jgi:hypothetical protein
MSLEILGGKGMEKKFNALRTIGVIFKIFGVIAGIITLLIVIGICATSVLGGAAIDSLSRELGNSGASGIFGGVLGGLLASIFVIINGGGLTLTFFALGEGIYVLLSVEENTRATVDLLGHQSDL